MMFRSLIVGFGVAAAVAVQLSSDGANQPSSDPPIGVQPSVNEQNQNDDVHQSSFLERADSLESSGNVYISGSSGGGSGVTKSSNNSSDHGAIRTRREGLFDSKPSLLRAAEDGNVQELQECLLDSTVDLNLVPNGFGRTALHLACENNHEEVVRMLLEREVDVNKEDRFDYTPLYVACRDGCTAIVEMLLADQRVDVNKATDCGRTPLYIASRKFHVEVVRILLADPRVNVTQAMDDFDETPLQAVISWGNDQDFCANERQRYAQIVDILQDHLNNA